MPGLRLLGRLGLDAWIEVCRVLNFSNPLSPVYSTISRYACWAFQPGHGVGFFATLFLLRCLPGISVLIPLNRTSGHQTVVSVCVVFCGPFSGVAWFSASFVQGCTTNQVKIRTYALCPRLSRARPISVYRRIWGRNSHGNGSLSAVLIQSKPVSVIIRQVFRADRGVLCLLDLYIHCVSPPSTRLQSTPQ